MPEPGNHATIRLNQVGCIGRCKVCGKAIMLMATFVDGSQFWAHFGVGPSHYAVLNPGVCDA